MKKIFSHYYTHSHKDFPKLWRECLFVLDTNILLNLYRFPYEARKDLLHILSIISDRLWIPFQVALEFQENRLSVIAEQKNSFLSVKDKINNAIRQLEKDLANLQLKSRHSSINPDKFLEKIKKITNEFMEELDVLDEEQPDVFDKDTLRDEIDKLCNNKIGNPPTKDELDAIYKEGKIRNEVKRPPGFRDIGKSKEEKVAYFYNNLELRREFGDLMIWKQIIKKAKEGHKYIVFITDDGKDDWWQKEIRGKVVGVRPELLGEISVEGSVSMFHMYNSEQFMKHANEYLSIKINDNSLNQVRDTVNFTRQNVIGHQNNSEVIHWLKIMYSGCDFQIINYSNVAISRIILSSNSDRFVYRVFYLNQLASTETQILLNVIAKEENPDFDIIVVAGNRSVANDIKNMLAQRKHAFKVIIGTIEYDEDFAGTLFEPLTN